MESNKSIQTTMYMLPILNYIQAKAYYKCGGILKDVAPQLHPIAILKEIQCSSSGKIGDKYHYLKFQSIIGLMQDEELNHSIGVNQGMFTANVIKRLCVVGDMLVNPILTRMGKEEQNKLLLDTDWIRSLDKKYQVDFVESIRKSGVKLSQSQFDTLFNTVNYFKNYDEYGSTAYTGVLSEVDIVDVEWIFEKVRFLIKEWHGIKYRWEYSRFLLDILTPYFNSLTHSKNLYDDLDMLLKVTGKKEFVLKALQKYVNSVVMYDHKGSYISTIQNYNLIINLYKYFYIKYESNWIIDNIYYRLEQITTK